MRATVITDASYCHETKSAGWAAWIRVDGIGYPVKMYGGFKMKINTPTEAEMYAALNGLWIAKKYGSTRFILQTDCMAVVNAANGKSDNKSKTIKSYRKALNVIGIPLHFIDAKHVKGHTKIDDARSYVNRWCDKMAKKEMRKARQL